MTSAASIDYMTLTLQLFAVVTTRCAAMVELRPTTKLQVALFHWKGKAYFVRHAEDFTPVSYSKSGAELGTGTGLVQPVETLCV